ncbi:MAG TPA: glycosyltransferase [Thermoanaerobaculia bacterium]|nr:glycosyltransferase [Thermoanaerobaculia bacterium]
MPSGDAPPLTVFTPFYKNIEYFDETIVSVLSQSFRDFEYLMINDGDPAVAAAIQARYDDPRIRIINTPSPLGLGGSRNAGLHEARGALIAFIDSDDVCEPGRFEKQEAFLRSHPDHVLVGSALRYINAQSRTIGRRRYPENDEDIKKRMVVMNCIAQPSVMARRTALIEAGGYVPEFPAAEDYDLWLRAARLGKFHNLPEELVAYRIHPAAGKNLLLKPALRDSTRLKIRAIRRYGFHATPRALASIVMHSLLLLLPSRAIFWLFNRLIVNRQRE